MSNVVNPHVNEVMDAIECVSQFGEEYMTWEEVEQMKVEANRWAVVNGTSVPFPESNGYCSCYYCKRSSLPEEWSGHDCPHCGSN